MTELYYATKAAYEEGCDSANDELTATQEELKSAIQQRDEARLQAQHYRDAFYKNCEPYLFSWEQSTN